ncbi:MAG: hypothetical protein MHM6MM_009612, partial [Cercozoa sp. M6MM]
ASEHANDAFFSVRWTLGANKDKDERHLHGYVPEVPFEARMMEARWLTQPEAEKHVLHLELSCDSPLVYHVGDALGIYCANNETLVDAVLARLGVQEEQRSFRLAKLDESAKTLLFHETAMTLREAFLYCVDLHAPLSKATLRVLAESCTDKVDKTALWLLCSRDGGEQYRREVAAQQPNLLQV